MSVEAITWVLQQAVGVDQAGAVVDVPSNLLPVLLGLANHAHPDGTCAHPGQPTLARYARKSDRAVRKDLSALLTLKVIRKGDQRLVEHYPADKRPVVYDLAVERRRPDPGSDRNHSTYRQEGAAGTTVPGAPGQQVPPDHDPPEPDDRPEPQFRPEPQDRPLAQMGRNHRTGRSVPGGTTVPVAAGTTVPPNRPSNPKGNSSSSSSPLDPSSLVDRYSRSVAIIRAHLDDVDDDEAARLADWIMVTYRPAPALLGAYVRRMALAGDLAAALAEHRAAAAAGGRQPDPGRRPRSLIALDQRATAVLYDAVHDRAAEVRAELRPTRTPPTPEIRLRRPPPPEHDPPPAAAAAG